MKLYKLPNDLRLAHHLRDPQHEISRRHTLAQTAAEMNTNNIRS